MKYKSKHYIGLFFLSFLTVMSLFSYLVAKLYGLGIFGKAMEACKDAATACYKAVTPFSYYLDLPTKILVAGMFTFALYSLSKFIFSTVFTMFAHANYSTGCYYKSKRISAILHKHGIENIKVKVIKSGKPIAYAFGLLSPSVYISTKIINELSEDELESVILHEAGHIRHKDNIWGLIVTAFKDLMLFLPVIKILYSFFWAGKEHEADDYVVRHTNNPLSLASAIVKISKLTRGQFYPGYVAAFSQTNAIEGRVKRLLNQEHEIKINTKKLALSLLLSIIILFSLVTLAFAIPRNENLVGSSCNMQGNCESMKNQICGK